MESHFSLHDGVATTTSLLVLLFFLYSLHKLKNMIHTTNSKHTPPQPSGSWPFIGHLPLLGKLPHITFGNLADQYGPIFMIKLGVNRALVVSKAEMVKQCLGANDRVFANRPHTIFVDHLTYKSAMVGFTPYGEYWRQIRKIFTVELLSSHRIEMLKDVRINEVKAAIKVLHDHCMMENLRGNAVDSLTVDLQKWFNDVTMNSIVRLIAGKSMKEFYEGEKYDKYAKAFREFFELAGVFLPADALPFLRWIDIGGHEKKMKKLAKVMDQIVDDWLMDHKERIGCKNSQPQDFMDKMLNKFENGQEISSIFDTDTIIKANCMNLILAASDTSGTTLTWALALLVNNLDILKKAQAELDKVVGKERQVEESDIKNLVYLQAIVKETLRLYPPGTLSVPREAITECTIGGYHIPARTQLLVNLYKLHRDPNVWENPLEFNPERFLTSHKDYDVIGKNFEYLPFGSGRRLCPGISYALRIMHFTLATLLHEFQVLSPLDQLVDMSEDFGLSNSKATPLELILKKRLPHI